MSDRDPNLIVSPLSGPVTIDGVTVDVQIYRLEHDPRWALEVINEAGTSTVWDDLFDSDDEAFRAFTLTVEQEGMEAFAEEPDATDFPTLH